MNTSEKDIFYGFEVADVPFSVECPFALDGGKYAGRFSKKVSFSSFVCTVSECDGFAPAKGEKVLDDYLTRLYLDGGDITNDQIFSPAGRILFRSHYAVSQKDVIPVEVDRTAKEFLKQDNLWTAIDLPYQLSFHGVLVLHSSSVDIGGRAILFCAPSGTGKSTQAGLWEKYRGAKQMNGDKNAIRLRGNVPCAFGLPFCGSSDVCENYALPIAAIVVLSQAKENTIRRLGFIQAVSAISNNCVGHNVIPGTVGRITNTAVDIASVLPVYHLACTPDERAVETLEKVIL